MGTIIKDFKIINEDYRKLIKEELTLKNEYNVIGKSYNKKEKIKTQLTNYDISCEFFINKNEKTEFFNIFNNKNYYLYDSRNKLNVEINNSPSNICLLYINIDDINSEEFDVFKYTEINRLYLNVNNMNLSLKFDDTYNFIENGKYRFIDEISMIGTYANFIGSAKILYLSILNNNNISYKMINEDKYILNFELETINNIIQKKEIINTSNTNTINIEEFKYNQQYQYYTLYNKIIKISEQFYFFVDVYMNTNYTISEKVQINSPFIVKVNFKKFYFNGTNFELVDNFQNDYNLRYDHLNFSSLISKYNGLPENFTLNLDLLLKYFNFKTYYKNNKFYLTITSAENIDYRNNYKEYDTNYAIYIKKFNYKKNILLKNTIFYFEFKEENEKLNIIDTKICKNEELIKFNVARFLDEQFYNISLNTAIYKYNDKLYLTTSCYNKFITSSYSENEDKINIVFNDEDGNMGFNWNRSYWDVYYYYPEYINYSDEKYLSLFQSVGQESNSDEFELFNFIKNRTTILKKNSNELLYNKINLGISDAYNAGILKNGVAFSDHAPDTSCQQSFTSNGKTIFLYNYGASYYNILSISTIEYLFKKIVFKDENNNLKKINIINDTKNLIRTQSQTIFDKNINYYYYNSLTNKHYISFIEYWTDVLGESVNTIIEFEYDENETITLTKKYQFRNSLSSFKNMDILFDENYIYIYLVVNNSSKYGGNEEHKKIYIKKLDYNFNIILEQTIQTYLY